jgi:hypothetical protein
MPRRVLEPYDDVTVYLVLNDHGKNGIVYDETDPAQLDFGQFSKRRMREMSQNIGVHRIFSGSRARPGPCENSRRHQKYL